MCILNSHAIHTSLCHSPLSQCYFFTSYLKLPRMKEHRRADFERIDKLTAMETGGWLMRSDSIYASFKSAGPAAAEAIESERWEGRLMSIVK